MLEAASRAGSSLPSCASPISRARSANACCREIL